MKLTETEKRIILTVENDIRSTPKLIAKKLNISEQHVRNLMSNLSRFGLLNRIARGVYEKAAKDIPGVKKVGIGIKKLHSKVTKKKK